MKTSAEKGTVLYSGRVKPLPKYSQSEYNLSDATPSTLESSKQRFGRAVVSASHSERTSMAAASGHRRLHRRAPDTPISLAQDDCSRADKKLKDFPAGDGWVSRTRGPLRFPNISHHVSTHGRFLPERGVGGGSERKPRSIHLRVSTGSITSSTSRTDAMLMAFPCAYAMATMDSNSS